MTDSRLIVCIFSIHSSLLALLKHRLPQGSFLVHDFSDKDALIHHIVHEEQSTDCLIFEDGVLTHEALKDLQRLNLLLPCVLITHTTPKNEEQEPSLASGNAQTLQYIEGGIDSIGVEALYHNAMQSLSKQDISDQQALQTSVEKSINSFLQLPAESPLLGENRLLSDPELSQDVFTSLSNKQRQLSVKLQERLGYLGVYYKRNPNSFLKRMSVAEKQDFLNNLRTDYRDIILNYFSDAEDLNQQIDRYVTTAFFADVPTAQMVQIHMELMDEFSKQLKLEGRNEEILLDYRLTLIDMLANLCELYRRSIPRL
ncbi:MAG: circadian clock protein KaiA [Cyanobacteria bacterium P01_F01_bin.150]